MKFAMAMVVYVLMGAGLCWGILSAVHGNPWLLIVGLVTYALALGVLGCLPQKSH